MKELAALQKSYDEMRDELQRTKQQLKEMTEVLFFLFMIYC
jgi:peptidoglycan hydrolase CwlO-like protein